MYIRRLPVMMLMISNLTMTICVWIWCLQSKMKRVIIRQI